MILTIAGMKRPILAPVCWPTTRLGRHYGYSLVYAKNRGVNIFFIRDDVLEHSGVVFKDTNCVEKLFKHPVNVGSGPNGGNLPDPYRRVYVGAEELL